MKIIGDLEQLHITEPTAVAIGKFDGVHVGHRMLLDTVLTGKKRGLKTAVFTFEPSPTIVFGNGNGKILMTRMEKREMFEQMGIDYLVEYPLNARTASVEPQRFIRTYLVSAMNAKLIVAGKDLSYGDRGRGDFVLLNSLKDELGYETVMIEKICMDGEEISSSRIRALIEEGNVKLAQRYLGEPYFIRGTVVHGAQLGRNIGIPTVNLIPATEKLLPPFGVYYSEVLLDGIRYPGMTNIGRKPTVNQGKDITVETYLYDYSGNVYGKKIVVCLRSFRRKEQKFEDITQLKAQMQMDIEAGRQYFHL